MHCDIIIKVRQTKCTYVKFNVIFYNVIYMYSFEPEENSSNKYRCGIMYAYM